MSTPDQKISDALTLITDAVLEGQLQALRKVHEALGRRLSQSNGLTVTAVQPVERMKARGAVDVLELLMRELAAEIARIELERGS